jgi:hypothetical protein
MSFFSSSRAPDVLLERAAMEDFLRNPLVLGASASPQHGLLVIDRDDRFPLPLRAHTPYFAALVQSVAPASMRFDEIKATLDGNYGEVRQNGNPFALWNSRIATGLRMHAAPAQPWRGPSGTAVRIQGDLTNFSIGDGIGISNRHLSPALSVVRRAQQLQANAAKRYELLALQSAYSTGTASTGGDIIFDFFRPFGFFFGGGHR